MKTMLFFDDHRLFGRDGLSRRYGEVKLESSFSDGYTSTDHPAAWCFKTDDGTYKLLYMAQGTTYRHLKLFCCVSNDGINFTPANLAIEGTQFDHEIPFPALDAPGCEIATVYEDKNASDPSLRYRMLFARYDDAKLRCDGNIYSSADLINWTLCEGSWSDGTEPIASLFYNEYTKKYTSVLRPFWGIRRIGYKTSENMSDFGEFKNCLISDACDAPLDELYGMYAFEYDGMFIGAIQIYSDLHGEYNAKFHNGSIYTQLAYSYDGEYWMRSLRTPFISGKDRNPSRPLAWTSGSIRLDDGDLLIYGTSSEYEHGPAFRILGTGRLDVYRVRKDGFVALCTEKGESGSLILREQLWKSGEMHLNLKAAKATVAVRCTDHDPGNCLSISEPIEGFTHEDCVPFSGDSKDWIPTWNGERSMKDLVGRTIVIEIRITDGEIYSMRGDFIDLYNTEAVRYRILGKLPNDRS